MEMKQDPNLRDAMRSIKTILQQHDITGLILLHSQNHAEHLVHLNASWSCVAEERDPDTAESIGFRIKTTHLPPERRKQTLEDTTGMILSTKEHLAVLYGHFAQVARAISHSVEISHRQYDIAPHNREEI
jgi:hypothetical protein